MSGDDDVLVSSDQSDLRPLFSSLLGSALLIPAVLFSFDEGGEFTQTSFRVREVVEAQFLEREVWCKETRACLQDVRSRLNLQTSAPRKDRVPMAAFAAAALVVAVQAAFAAAAVSVSAVAVAVAVAVEFGTAAAAAAFAESD